MTAMDRDEADQELTALGGAYDRIAAAMYTLDSHPGLTFLKGGALAGRTLEAWRSMQPRIDVLWAQFTSLRTQLELARVIRGQRSRLSGEELAELVFLLREPVIEFDAAGMPVDPAAPGRPMNGSPRPGSPGSAGSGPSGGGPAGGRLRLGELASQVEHGCAEVIAVLTEVDAACATMVAGIAPAADGVMEVQALATELGAEPDPVLARLATDLSALREQALDDPLATADPASGFDAGLRRLSTAVSAARTALAEVARVRDEFPNRVQVLRRAVDELAAAEGATGQSYQLVQVKIADPGLPPPPSAAAALRDRVSALEQDGQPGQSTVSGRWQRLASVMSTLEREVAVATDRTRQLRAAADGLLDRRAELRGRLEAYRAKAARLGYAEHPGLTDLHGQARDLLYTSPCDLPAATGAMLRYQQMLAELSAPPRDAVPGSTPSDSPTPEDREPSR
jgi:hypothetical protein